MIMIKKLPDFKDLFMKTYQKLPPRLGSEIIISALLFLLILGTFTWNLIPVSPGKTDLQLLKIQYGTSLRDISRQLKADGLIRSKLFFEAYVRLDYKNRMAKAGWYRVGPNFSVPKLVRLFHRGTPQNIIVTITEGLTINEIADLLAKKNLVDRKHFLAIVRDLNFVNGILGDFQVGPSAEGYLFPDTYDFTLPVSEEQIISRMLNRFKEVYDQNFSNIPDSKRREIVIVASLVEMEARRAGERPIIAGIFYNRLRLGYRLESCATVQYVLGTHKHLYYKDLKINSPYNTYLRYGLPPGPIANPGLASLKAAANPASVRYLYFVAKPDGTHIFNKDYRDHLKAQKQVERLRVVSQTGQAVDY
jgi:UPF0755 protein